VDSARHLKSSTREDLFKISDAGCRGEGPAVGLGGLGPTLRAGIAFAGPGNDAHEIGLATSRIAQHGSAAPRQQLPAGTQR
jgi:hypothetical protein